MGSSRKFSDGQKESFRKPSTTILLTITDTTWRMFFPSVGLTFFGIWLDGKLSTTPWMMFTGIILGLGLAALAVKLQVDRLK